MVAGSTTGSSSALREPEKGPFDKREETWDDVRPGDMLVFTAAPNNEVESFLVLGVETITKYQAIFVEVTTFKLTGEARNAIEKTTIQSEGLLSDDYLALVVGTRDA